MGGRITHGYGVRGDKKGEKQKEDAIRVLDE